MSFEKRQTKAIYVGARSLADKTLSLHDYAQGYQLYSILSEATKIFLRKNNLQSNQVIGQFLQQCNKGEHVLLKSYSSFCKSVMNKICFLYNFIKIFEVESNARNGLDYYQLFRLLCSDFPKDVIARSIGLLLPNQDPSLLMYKQVNSKKLIISLYTNFIYSEYLDAMLHAVFQDDPTKVAGIQQIFIWIKQYEMRVPKIYQKPIFEILVQTILNIMRKQGLILQESSLIFITEENIDEFIREKSSTVSQEQASINYRSFMHQLLESPEHGKLVQQNLEMFENSQNWANEVQKILSTKESTETPLNVKKNTKNIKK